MVTRQAGVARADTGGSVVMDGRVLLLTSSQRGLEDLGMRPEDLLQLVKALLELPPVAGAQAGLLSLLVFA